MKNIILILLTVLFVACQSPVVPTSPGVDHKIIVKDALWNTVSVTTITVTRALTVDEIQARIDEFNAVTLDDYQRLYIDEAPDLSNAPPATVFVCNPETNNPNEVWEDIPRSSLVANWASWKASYVAQIIYVDHIPPAIVQDKTINPYAWYALYIVDNDTGDIVFEDHCGFHPDQSFDSGGLIEFSGVDTFYSVRLAGFNAQVGTPVIDALGGVHNSCRVVSRTLYVPQSPLP